VEVAFSVKCPSHGDRFVRDRMFIYVAKWMREKIYDRVLGRIPDYLGARHVLKYRKAYLASFPADLWSSEEEETCEGGFRKTYLLLQDGTRLQVVGYGLAVPGCNDGDDARNTDEAKERRAELDRASAKLDRAYEQIWEMETLRTMARLLSQRGRIVDPRLLGAKE
jgi:hypothetical protein